MSAITRYGFVLILLLALAGCTTGSNPVIDAAVELVASAPPAADFSGMIPVPDFSRSAAATTAACLGSAYTTGRSRNAAPDGDAAVFTPDWQTAAPDPAGLAFACYAFDLAGYTGAQTIGFTWNETGPAGEAWVGLANVATQRWDWQVLPDPGPLSVDFTDYTSAAPERLQLIVVCCGTATWELAEIRLGELPAPPAAPTDVAASDGTYADRVTVTWTPAGGATAYLVYRDSQAAELAVLGDVATWDDTTLADTDPHTYWVKARNTGGDSAFSTADTGYLAAGDAPDPPADLRASDYLCDVIRLDWTKAVDATSYEVYRDAGLLTTVGDVNYCIDDGIGDTNDHAYTVRSIGAGGTSGHSAPAVGSLAATPYGPGDWPQYSHDCSHTGLSTHTGPATNNLRWSVDLNDLTGGDTLQVQVGFSGPSIDAAGTIYIGSTYSRLFAISPDGELRWVYKAYMWDIGVPAVGPDGRIYICDSSNKIRCFHPWGEIDWTIEYPQDDNFAEHAVIDAAGNVYAASYNGNVHKLDADGWEAGGWPFEMSGACEEVVSPAVGLDGTVYCGARVVTGGDAYFQAINADGSEKYHYTYTDIYSSPLVDALGNACVIANDHIYSYKPDGSDYNWISSANDTFGSPSLAPDGSVYIGTEGNDSNQGFFRKLTPTGGEDWAKYHNDDVYSTPAVDAEGNVYYGCRNGYVYAWNADGSERWSYDTGVRVDSSPAITADGCLLIGDNNGLLYCFGPAT